MSHKVLVVEDDRVMARLESAALDRAGVATVVAYSAADALDLVANDEFDLIVLDLFLPDGDGVAICSQMRAFSSAPVLMVSCLEDDLGKPLTATVDGPHRFLSKPFAMHDFVGAVEALLAGETA